MVCSVLCKDYCASMLAVLYLLSRLIHTIFTIAWTSYGNPHNIHNNMDIGTCAMTL